MMEPRTSADPSVTGAGEEIARLLREFIVRDLEWRGDPGLLTPDYPLIDHGVIDSLGVLMLFSFVEDRFGVRVELSEFTPQNLETIAAMVGFIRRKQEAGHR